MSTSAISSFSASYLQQALASALPSAANSNGTSSTQPSSDSSGLSSFGQLVSTLQQLQETDPAKYKQVTQQISTNLLSAAQTEGNSGAASQINQIASDFATASQSGQLPDLQNLTDAVSGGGHHHHHGGEESGGGVTSSASTAPSRNSTTDPLTIISQTLSQAGLGSSSS